MAEQSPAPTSEVEVALLSCVSCGGALIEAVLLPCLHNVCSRCVGSMPSAASNGSQGLTCPACHEQMSLTSQLSNEFLSALALEAAAGRASRACDICVNGSDGDLASRPSAEVYCGQCDKSLCAGCLSWHKKLYKQQHLQVVSLPSSLPLPGQPPMLEALRSNRTERALPTAARAHAVQAVSCRKHGGAACSLFCFSCAELECVKCSRACTDAGHEVQPLGCAQVRARAAELRRSIEAACAALEASTCNAPPTEAEATATPAKATLAKNRLHVLEAIERVHDGAEVKLRALYSSLLPKPSAAMAEVWDVGRLMAQLEVKAEHALSYSQRLLDEASGHHCVAALLQQHGVVLARLHRLFDQAAALTSAWQPREAADSKDIVIESERPGDTEEIVRRWLGLSSTLADNPSTDMHRSRNDGAISTGDDCIQNDIADGPCNYSDQT